MLTREEAPVLREDSMSDITRYTLRLGDHGYISYEPDAAGRWLRWDDHQAEVEGLKVLVRAKQTMTEKVWTDAQKSVERLEAEIKRLTAGRDGAQADMRKTIRERDFARDEVERLKAEATRLTTKREAALRKAEALQIVVDGERSRMDAYRVDTQAAITLLTKQRDEAQAEVERRITECGEAWVEVERLRREERQAADRERELARGTIDRLEIERDFAQREGQKLKAEVERLTDAGNHSASLDRSRPSDEDIWREAFFALWERYWVHGQDWVDGLKEMTCADAADIALHEYRKRWPR